MPEDQQIGDGSYGQYEEEHVSMQEESPEDKMRQMMQQIEEFVQDSGQPWSDPDFPADDSSLYINPV